MQVTLIKASADSEFKKYKASMGGPPQNIFSVAAATPQNIQVELIDETVGMKVKYNTKSKIIAIFMSTPDAIRGYEIADKFRKKGKIVVLGGLHPTFLSDESQLHADAIILGEAEGCWEQIIEDVKNNVLKKCYHQEKPFDLSKLNPYPTNIVDMNLYGNVWSVVVGRGCNHGCRYYVVNPFFKSCRFRPIEHIIAEIKQCGAKLVELHADNLIADRDYAIRLFKAMEPLNIQWMGEATIMIAEDDELLDWAVRSGLKYMLIGIETPSKEALESVGKGFIDVDNVKKYVKKLQSKKIQLDASFLFGFDAHEKDIFQRTLDYAKEVGVDECHGVIMTPFPGTPLYRQMKQEGRISTEDWSKYDCTHAVYTPIHMTPKELEKGTWWFDVEFHKWQKKNKKGATLNQPNNLSQSSASLGSVRSMGFTNSSAFKWKTLLAFGFILTSLFMNWTWVWSVFFLYWVIGDIKSGYTFIAEPISRDENPIWYWLIITLWLGLAIYTIYDIAIDLYVDWFYLS
ncbi:radical SAM protein [Lutibacter sp. B2]|nr:radical SAM protein [Lutibacter sp. B2]